MAQLQTLTKALDILTLLGKSERYMSVEELAKILVIPESTVYRLIQTLESADFVRRYSRNEIGLGIHFINLGRMGFSQLEQNLILKATPVLEEVSAVTEETSLLCIREGMEVHCLREIPSHHPIRFAPEQDRKLPLTIGASSLAILAYERQHVINQVIEQLDSEEKKNRLLDELEAIRSRGYSTTDNQFDASALGFAAPVFDMNNRVYASVAIVGPDSRMRAHGKEFYIHAVTEAAAELTTKIKTE